MEAVVEVATRELEEWGFGVYEDRVWRFLKMSTKRLLLSVLLTLALPVATLANGFSGAVTVHRIHIEGNSFAYVEFNAAGANPDSCGTSGQAMVRNGDPYYTSTLAFLMEMYAIGGTMNFYYLGCQATPWGYTMPVIWSAESL